jgi:hypothetical protein
MATRIFNNTLRITTQRISEVDKNCESLPVEKILSGFQIDMTSKVVFG